MGGNKFYGEIPSSYCSNWPDILELEIFETYIGGDIPSFISNCETLESLVLSKNNFTGSLDILGSLTNLIRIDVSDNQLEGDIDVILNFPMIGYIKLDNNKLTGIIPNEIDQLTNLKYMFLYNNKLEGNIPSSIGNLSNLQIMCVKFLFFLNLNDLIVY